MIQLFKGCYCSDPSIHPKNWNKAGASTNQDWYIQYRFYDPEFCFSGTHKPKPVLRIIKGMNRFEFLSERREAVKILMAEELRLLKIRGYNPITKQFMAPILEEIKYEVDPNTPFIKALRLAMEKLSVTPRTMIGIKSVIAGVEKAAKQLRFDVFSISEISRRHIKLILEQSGKNSKQWSNTRYNLYRGYLMMLFKELVELEAAPMNPVRDISKKQITQKIKQVLTDQERKAVDEHLLEAFPAFREFVHIFFHSGGRKTELLQLRPSMIDLGTQTYKCTIKKGRSYKEVIRTIKTIAIPHWKYFIDQCEGDLFLFGPLFKPGATAMGEGMPTTYWKKYVKQDLGITADFYSLKHLNTSEVVDALDEAAAARLNAHTSTGMVVQIYDVKQRDRQHNRLKEVANGFV